MGFEALEELRTSMRAGRDERYENRRYLVRVITNSGLSGFIQPREEDCFVPAKKNACRYVSLRNAVDTREIAASKHKSAWIVFDYIGE